MNRRSVLVVALLAVGAPVGRSAEPNVVLASRLVGNGSRSLLVDVRGPAGQPIDDVRIELPDKVAESAVSLSMPPGWRSGRDGRSIRLSGTSAVPPFRMRIALYETKEFAQAHVTFRQQDKKVSEESVMVSRLPPVTTAASPNGLAQIPSVVTPGESIEIAILDPSHTPNDGHWTVAGVEAAQDGANGIRVTLPKDLAPGAPLSVSYVDAWGERLLDALSADDVVVHEPTQSDAEPRITACSQYGFRGDSLCVCGNFPEASRKGLMIDGRPAEVSSASQHVVNVRVTDAIALGAHSISGDASSGFRPTDIASTNVVALRASIDANALMRGQSTMLRLAIEAATQPMPIAIINRTPHIVSIQGGNYRQVDAPADVNNPLELRVDARSPGNFLIDTKTPGRPCPCMETADRLSTASQSTPVFVPARVLATIAAGTPAAAMTAAQAIAVANGLAVVDVTPLPLTNEALITFAILDGIGAIAKAAALAGLPNVTLSQPDFVYDTTQAPSSSPSLAYGSAMIGADAAHTIARGDGVRIAVIDAGIDTGHVRLKNRVVDYSDVTGTGWTPDAHGTLVAGVIAADAGDGEAPTGVAPGANIVAIKSCVADSPTLAAAHCWSSTLARGIDAASRKNVRVMNLSVGGPNDRLLAKMVAAATAHGITLVSAAGNDGPSGKPSYPAAMDHVLAVTAVDATGQLYPRATQGSFIALAAPGVDILSTGPGGRAQLFSGTSAATAFASGAVALLLQRSNLSPAELRNLLTSTAKHLGRPGPDPQFGAGLIDVCHAIVKASGQQTRCP